MNAALLDRDTVLSAIELASRAPSVHNSQPWRWYLGDHSVHLYADLRRWLPATDSDGRDLLVSCGAALHHLRIALAACGLRTRVRHPPNPDEPDHLASIELHTARNLPLGGSENVPAARQFPGGELTYRPEPADGARLLLLGTASDDRLSQLRAGEALSALPLEATDLGLATCPLSQPLEVDTTRRYLRDSVLDGHLSPQLLIRTGWAPTAAPLPATPRRPLADTVEPLPR